MLRFRQQIGREVVHEEMAVCWRCPSCGETSCEDDMNVTGNPVVCDHCGKVTAPAEALCPVCETSTAWSRRDSLHFVCRECGNSQTFYSHLPVAG